MKINVQFVNHIQAGMAEQGVFIENGSSGQVTRPTAEDAKNGAVALYTASVETEDDPFKVGTNPLGPFPKGRALGVTFQQWLAATGSGTYTVDGDSAELKLTFQNLVQNGVYTLLSPRLTFPPNFKIEPGIPGGDMAKATTKADDKGNAAINLKLKPLAESTKETATALLLAYNSVGEWRGEFGKNTHPQIFVMLPAAHGI